MCLSVPSCVIELKEDITAAVEVFGARRLISLDLLQAEIGGGDWVRVHEGRAFRERKIRSLWFRGLVEICVVDGDRGYRGCEGVIVLSLIHF